MEDILLRSKFKCNRCGGMFPVIDRHENCMNNNHVYLCPACDSIIENQRKIEECGS